MLSKIRKAVTAAVTAGVGAAVATIGQAALDGVVNRDDVAHAIGFAISAAVLAGYATFRVPNAVPAGAAPNVTRGPA